ncbi:MAG: GuaB3 family IMP dehydrogenase-related protein [Coriobacteriia bacterium]|nr:GuaB3 family IMP dehydrogenase-related protein [Coriobacteriia bacterium]MBN2823248.1 GuaB3 family IMP dehydrogenase-related protein [Coriobacteriia bacterium]
MEVEIGRGKTARRAYGFDDIAIVPSRRTRDPRDVNITWEFSHRGKTYNFPLPVLASAMDGVVDPEFAITMGKLGGLAVLNLEGIQTRYEDPTPHLDAIASFSKDEATPRMQEIYAAADVKPELITQRVKAIKAGGVLAAASLTPQNVERYIDAAMAGGLDILVIQGTVVSAEHVSTYDKPLDLNAFIRDLDIPVIVGGCCSYQGALHLMRTGAVGVLVGVGPGHACTSRRVLGIGVPQCTAVADAAAARMRHLDETGTYCHVIADGGMRTGGDLAKAIAVGADSVMIGSPLASASEAPGRGFHWGMATFHPDLPRGARVQAGIKGSLEDILVGPARENDGTLNLCGGLRTSMATCGYENLKTFQKAEVMVAPSLQTEGKVLQQSQGVGMGR